MINDAMYLLVIFVTFIMGVLIGITTGLHSGMHDNIHQTSAIMRNYAEERCVEPIDGWGTPLKFIIDDCVFTVVSAGRDKMFNTEDDLIRSVHNP